jgi:cellulose synthase/poly-beta-1,6-N-acetylglucosamine synthase-like glycosyltransferase
MTRKSPLVYWLIIAAWAVLLLLTLPTMARVTQDAYGRGILVGGIVVASNLFIAYFWLNGTKDIIYTLYYHLWFKRRFETPPVRTSIFQPRVVMMYCTYNDFASESLVASAQQDYGNFETVILDDSPDPRYRAAVDAFAAEHSYRVIRRDDREGFKAGSMNRFLVDEPFDYFVILDSDEILPPDFINRCLDYFADDASVGIVQANHIATRNRNEFMCTYSIGVDAHWIAYQTVKDRHGFLSLLGHGAMVSRSCFYGAKGFPHVVAEDLCFAIRARDAGFLTAFAPDVICEEEYPVDYLAFKRRHSKWTQGNMEFIKRFSGLVARASMSWYEKLDIVLFTYALPLTMLFSWYVVIHVMLLPLLGYRHVFPLWVLIPTVAFLYAPMLNDTIFYARRMRATKLLSYLGYTMLLYGSMFYISLRSALTSAFGHSTFMVTPKEDERLTLRQALRANLGEVTFGFTLGLVATALTQSVLPVLLLSIPAMASPYLTVLHQTPGGFDECRPVPPAG